MTGVLIEPTESRGAICRWFLVAGFVTASWVAHVPRQKFALETTHGPLGLALLCMALGAIIGMTAAPWLISRVGAGRAGWGTCLVYTCLVPLPILASSVLALALALLVFGLFNGAMDVTINAEGTSFEKQLGQPVMSSFHGWFSVGMVAGVSGGFGILYLGFPPASHAILVIVLAAGLLLTNLPSKQTANLVVPASSGLLEGINQHAIVLAALAFVCLFLEGAMADWAGLLAVAFGADPKKDAPRAFMAFTATWAAGRFVGDRITALVGDVIVVGIGGLLAAAGLGLGLGFGTPFGVVLGSAIVGLGLANSIPILFRAAAGTDPTGRGMGLALVTSVGYTGFLVGPPLVGFTADLIGLPLAIASPLVVAGSLVLASGAGVFTSSPGEAGIVRISGLTPTARQLLIRSCSRVSSRLPAGNCQSTRYALPDPSPCNRARRIPRP